eukprot:TRINITY_DN1294_c0_g1_i1.p1 TRINITY_DN1294_c0_g1~~TRINITY_DN1294_c0_g1_i1.p1  ORF type:complete len:608 (-),score=202.04 TRINITY_DN1294_c0_g1_i1:50-1873(-)
MSSPADTTATAAVPSTTPATAAPTANAPASSQSFNSTSLYVGDIAPDVTETNLFEIFNAIGPVASIRVCRDAITRRSLGYAYVNFHNPQDAERALDTVNNQPIKNRPCRIMWSQRDPANRKSGRGNIFIKNLDKSIDHKALFDTFSQFGQILSCKIELDETNQSKGYGYIQFMNQESADKACQKVNGMMLQGKKVFVGPFVPRKDRSQNGTGKKFTNIYINNLQESVTDEELQKMFEGFGTVKSCVIMKDDAGKSKGFGFINYENAEEAGKAVDEMNGKDFNGKSLFVGRAQKKSEREGELRRKFELMKMEHMAKYQGVNLYVKNLDDDMDDSKLLSIFGQFGTITSAKVMYDSKGVSKGFGFICYTSPDEATKAVTEMNGKIVGSKPLYVALAQRKDVRKMQLEQRFNQMNKGMPPRMPGMGGPAALYNGAPVFFGGPGQPPYVFGAGPGMVPRGGRFPPAPGPYQAIPPNYLVVGTAGGRGQPPVKNVGGVNRGGNVGGGRGRGMKQPQNAQPVPVPVAMSQPVAEPVPTGPISVEEQKRMLGERLYPLIYGAQPQLAGKITGMILESSYVEEITGLIESKDALDEKVAEAVKVLKEHSEKAGSA